MPYLFSMKHLCRLGLLASLATLPILSACDTDTNAVTELCASRGNDFDFCHCYVDLMSERLDEEQFTMLADLSRFQLSDGMDESEARDTLIGKYGMETVLAFYVYFPVPHVEAELTCPAE